jgi:putative flippase GtrA
MHALFKKLHADSADNALIQLYRSIFSGAVATAVDFLILFLLTSYAGVFYLISACISFVVASSLNYTLCVSWVFPEHRFANKKSEFSFFILIGTSGLILNAALLFTLVSLFGLYYLFAKVIAAVLVFFWNFTARKLFLFSKPKQIA